MKSSTSYKITKEKKKNQSSIPLQIIEQNLKMAVLMYSATKLKGIPGKTFLLNDLLALGSWASQEGEHRSEIMRKVPSG